MKLHVVLPNDIDDPAHPSGGNRYDRRVCDGLTALGWSLEEHSFAGTWPAPAPAHTAELARGLSGLPDDALVLVDGLIASAAPDVLVPESKRLRIVVLMHMPLAGEAERQVVSAVDAVITTSDWCREAMHAMHGVAAVCAPPGVDPAGLAVASPRGDRLLCVAAVIPDKGHDVMLRALAQLPDLSWTCACVGALDSDPDWVAALRGLPFSGAPRVVSAGPRVTFTGPPEVASAGPPEVAFTGPLIGSALDAAYASTDLLVLPSRHETYGMVVTEALARGLPVLTTSAGGLPEALGRASDGSVPGLLVPPGDPDELAAALRRWLTEPALRDGLRRSARDRREALRGWPFTAERVAATLAEVSR